ncbi:MAG: UDP-N-acetylglucosamine 2-epimerase [Vicinamibacteria bacterium]
MKGRIAVLTTGRQDWGILRSTCVLLRASPAFDLRVLAGGMACSRRHGRTETLLHEDGFAPAESLPWVGDEGAAGALQQAGAAVVAVGEALSRQLPEALVLVGDRFETAAAALAATLCRVPLVHLHGGEETLGSMDNAFRHAITKLSHLHLVSHQQHRDRVIAMGEARESVHVVGAPGLDNARREDLADRAELEALFGLDLKPPVVLVTLHPVTLGGDPESEAQAVCAAMDAVEARYVITLPNTDPGHEGVRRRLHAATARPGRVAVEALGERRYWGLLRLCDALLGNSSSALIEAPLLRLPAVNVGLRQQGRMLAANVIEAPAAAAEIGAALTRALSARFRSSLADMDSPFGDGGAAERILSVLSDWTVPKPPAKRSVA